MQQFRLFRGKSGCYFVENFTTKKQSSLRTRDEAEAQRLLFAKNEAHREPILCLQMARAYLTAADPVMKDRTWQTVMAQAGGAKDGSTQKRWMTACKDRAFDLIRHLKLTESLFPEFDSYLLREYNHSGYRKLVKQIAARNVKARQNCPLDCSPLGKQIP